jgi:hypothetical protein
MTSVRTLCIASARACSLCLSRRLTDRPTSVVICARVVLCPVCRAEKIEDVFKRCKETNFPATHPLYEAAQIKLAELQSRDAKADDKKAAAGADAKTKNKMDPYAAKQAVRPVLQIAQYVHPPTCCLHQALVRDACIHFCASTDLPLLRSGY